MAKKLFLGSIKFNIIIIILILMIFMVSVNAEEKQISPADEANRLREALRETEEEEETYTIIENIFKLLGVKIIDYEEEPPDEEPYMYKYQIKIIAISYLDGQLMALEDLVAQWYAQGLDFFGPAGSMTGEDIELALRKIRRQAELAPNNWDGFVIRLLDALGDREKKPFALLSPEMAACQKDENRNKIVGGAEVSASDNQAEGSDDNQEDEHLQKDPRQMMMEGLAEEVARAEAEGDEETLAIIENMMAKGDDLDIDKITSGNFAEMLSEMFTGLEDGEGGEIEEGEIMEMLSEAEKATKEASDEADTEEEALVMDEISSMMGTMQRGTIEETIVQSQSVLKNMSLPVKKDIDQAREEAEKSSKRERENARSDDESDASTFFGIGLSEARSSLEINYMERLYEETKRYNEMLEEELKYVPGDEDREFLALYYTRESKEPTTCLFLDPIQVVLVEFDLFGLLTVNTDNIGRGWE